MSTVTPSQLSLLNKIAQGLRASDRAAIAQRLDHCVESLSWLADAADPVVAIPHDVVDLPTLVSTGVFRLHCDYCAGRHARQYRVSRADVIRWAKAGVADALVGLPMIDVESGSAGLRAAQRSPRIVDDGERPPVPRDSPAWQLLRAFQRRRCPVNFEELARLAMQEPAALAAAHALTRMGLKRDATTSAFSYHPCYELWSSGRLGEMYGGLQQTPGNIKQLVLGGDTYDLANCQPRALWLLATKCGIDARPLLHVITSLDEICRETSVPRAIFKQALIASCISGEQALRRQSRGREAAEGDQRPKPTRLEVGIKRHNQKQGTTFDLDALRPVLMEKLAPVCGIQRAVASAIIADAEALCRYIDWRRIDESAPTPDRSRAWSSLRRGLPGFYSLEVHGDGIHVRNAAGAGIPLLTPHCRRAHHGGRRVTAGRVIAHFLQGLEVAIMAAFESVSQQFGFTIVHHDHDGGQVMGEIPHEAVCAVLHALGWQDHPEAIVLVRVPREGAKQSVQPHFQVLPCQPVKAEPLHEITPEALPPGAARMAARANATTPHGFPLAWLIDDLVEDNLLTLEDMLAIIREWRTRFEDGEAPRNLIGDHEKLAKSLDDLRVDLPVWSIATRGYQLLNPRRYDFRSMVREEEFDDPTDPRRGGGRVAFRQMLDDLEEATTCMTRDLLRDRDKVATREASTWCESPC